MASIAAGIVATPGGNFLHFQLFYGQPLAEHHRSLPQTPSSLNGQYFETNLANGDSTYLAAMSAPFPPFFGQQAVGLRRSLPPPFPPLPRPSIEIGTNPWLPSIAIFGDGHANSCRAIYLLSRVHVYLPKTVSAQPKTLFTYLAVLWS